MTRANLFEQAVSLDIDALRHDLRVNYQLGLLLGVNEFQQEQFYNLQKTYLHSRTLHGYGTFYGLGVTAELNQDSTEVTVNVEPGLAIDQWGRSITVPTRQCAVLADWLKKKHPASGSTDVYVVLRYIETPVASTTAQNGSNNVASRIQDGFQLDISLEPPTEKSWAAARQLTDILAHVRTVPGLAADESDEAEIISQVKALIPGKSSRKKPVPQSPSPGFLRLPAETSRTAFDHILNIWLAEVRPYYEAQLINLEPDKQASSDILLARIGLSRNDNKLELQTGTPDISGRPYVLPAQILQELLYANDPGTTSQRPFATLRVLSSHTLGVWLHYPGVVTAPPASITVQSDGKNIAVTAINKVPLDALNVFEITIKDVLPAGARLEVEFKLDALLENANPLARALDALDFTYLGRRGLVLSEAIFVPGVPPAEFVTVSTHIADEKILEMLQENEIVEELEKEDSETVQAEEHHYRRTATQTDDTAELDAFAITPGTPYLRLWFHTGQPVKLPGNLPFYRSSVRSPRANRRTNFAAVPLVRDGNDFAYVWALFVPIQSPQTAPALRQDELITLQLDTETIFVKDSATTLSDFMHSHGQTFVGYDGNHTIQAHHEVKIPPRSNAISSESFGVIHEAVMAMPALPFVTITSLAQMASNGTPNTAVFELWFHLDHNGAALNETFRRGLTYSLFVEMNGNPPRLVEFPRERITVQTIRPNVWIVTLDTREWRGAFERSPYMRFIFPLAENRVTLADGRNLILKEYMHEHKIRFEGHSRFSLPGGEEREAIVAYARLAGGSRV